MDRHSKEGELRPSSATQKQKERDREGLNR